MNNCLYGVIHEDIKNNIYVFGSHQYALHYWTKALHNEVISLNAQLIHIDFHTDFLNPSVSINPLASPDEIKHLIEYGKIRHDTFIKPAISMGIVSNITFCCFKERNQPFGGFKNYVSPVELVKSLNSYKQNRKNENKGNNLFDVIDNGNLLLDIDLDYFFESDGSGGLRAKSKKSISEEVAAINELVNYATLTTVATSPMMYSQNKRDIVESTFSDNFAYSIDLTKSMPVEKVKTAANNSIPLDECRPAVTF